MPATISKSFPYRYRSVFLPLDTRSICIYVTLLLVGAELGEGTAPFEKINRHRS